MRFSTVRQMLPRAALEALRDATQQWWDGWLWLWGALFDREEQRLWRESQRETLDADLIDHGWHGGFAATSGGDEG